MTKRRNEHVVKRSGSYQFAVDVQPPRSAAEKVKIAEEYEMERMLQAARYKTPKRYAKILSREGMGPEELRSRMRLAPGEVGSLLYTHRFEKW
jgi:hypothetical protein